MDIVDTGLGPRALGPDHKARSGMSQPDRSNDLDAMDDDGCTLIWEDAQQGGVVIAPTI